MYETYIYSFDTVYSERTVAVVLHKRFISDLPLSVILSALSWIVAKLVRANRKLQPTSTIRSRFSSRLNSLILVTIVFCRFFAWIALGDVDFRFSLILVTLDNAVKGWTTPAAWLRLKRN